MKIAFTLLAALTFALSGSATAQAWPAKAVRIIVPYPPGGAVDAVTRKMAQKLTEQTGQAFIVENKSGATGTIGALLAARPRRMDTPCSPMTRLTPCCPKSSKNFRGTTVRICCR